MGRLPLSVLALASVLEGHHEYKIVDGNVDRNALHTLRTLLSDRAGLRILGVSVMPGTQMHHAIEHCRVLKKEFPDLKIIWGGYFPSMHTDSVLNSRYVDFVLRAQAETSFISLVEALRQNKPLNNIRGLSYRQDGKVIHNPGVELYDPHLRPLFPYHSVSMDAYAIPTFIGKRTFCHESSVGCPHKCNFCGVVDVFQSRWKAESPERTIEVIRLLKERYGMDGVEFHDSDFFVSEKRVRVLSEQLISLGIQWWGEGRVDTLLSYSRETWEIMRQSGLRMIFFGAESGLDDTLKLMDKGGVTSEKTKQIAAVCREYNVQSEFSFVMGSHPTRTEEDIDATIDLIYELERINPKSVVHPFIYTPVPFGSIYEEAVEGGLAYPTTLDEWAKHEWAQYTLRRNPHTPWLTKRLYRKIINFRAVQQAYFPKINDRMVSKWKLQLLKILSSWRYKFKIFAGAYELRILLRLFMNSTPSHEGF